MAAQEKTVTAWDEHGNPVTEPSGNATAWDENGNPVTTPSANIPDLKTGQGMQEYSQQKAKQVLTGTSDQGHFDVTGRKVSGPNGEPLSYMEKAEQAQADRQTKLGSAMNRAQQSPVPLTDAALAYAAPEASVAGLKRVGLTALRGVLGSAGGAYAGGHAGQYIGGETGEQLGKIGGGLAGGYLGMRGVRLPGKWGEISDLLGIPQEEPTFSPVSKSPGPYRGPASVPKQKPPLGSPENPGLMSKIPTGRSSMPKPPGGGIPQGSPTPFGNTPEVPYGGVVKLPVPNEAVAPINPKYMASVPRKALMGMGESGTPGAGTQLQQIGNRVLYLPEGGYAPPKSVSNIAETPQPIGVKQVGTANERPQVTYKPSEKASTMSEKPKDLGPEFSEGQVTHEIERNKSILRNPNATPEDIRIANQRLAEMRRINPSAFGRGDVRITDDRLKFTRGLKPGDYLE